LKTKIFQICFEKNQLNEVNSLFTPFDNTSNERPELREYHSFKRILNEGHTDDVDMWGVFGPRWNEKLKYSSKDIFEFIDNNPGHDVYIFNHARIVNAFTYNVWEQGEHWHPGIKEVSKYVLEKTFQRGDAIDVLMTDQTTCYCSYFVATKKFWINYINFLDTIKQELDNLPSELDKLYRGSANYGRDLTLNLFPFIIERMFSTYLIVSTKWKTCRKPYDYSVYESQVGDFYKVFDSVNFYKSIGPKFDSPELLQAWNNLRLHLVRNSPGLLSLD